MPPVARVGGTEEKTRKKTIVRRRRGRTWIAYAECRHASYAPFDCLAFYSAVILFNNITTYFVGFYFADKQHFKNLPGNNNIWGPDFNAKCIFFQVIFANAFQVHNSFHVTDTSKLKLFFFAFLFDDFSFLERFKIYFGQLVTFNAHFYTYMAW